MCCKRGKVICNAANVSKQKCYLSTKQIFVSALVTSVCTNTFYSKITDPMHVSLISIFLHLVYSAVSPVHQAISHFIKKVISPR